MLGYLGGPDEVSLHPWLVVRSALERYTRDQALRPPGDGRALSPQSGKNHPSRQFSGGREHEGRPSALALIQESRPLHEESGSL